MEDNEIIGFFEGKMKRVITFLEFLIVQPQLATKLTKIEGEKLMADNLIKVKCCKVWAENMEKEIKSKCSKELVKSVDGLFKAVEITKKEIVD